jgi:hypothetical protein
LKPSAPGAPPNGGVTTTVPAAPPAPGSTTPGANTAPAATHVGPDAAALAALEREELDDLTKRATKAATGLESVRATREAQGQHLPTDIDASRDKMKILMQQANTAIASGNVFAGQKFIDLAEVEIKKQEKFIGQ